MKTVAKKTRTDETAKQVIESEKRYDRESKAYDFRRRIIQYFDGGLTRIGKWLPIKSSDYHREKNPQITYDNHP